MRTKWSAENLLESERVPGRPLGDIARRGLRSLPIALLLFLVISGGLVFGARFLPNSYWSSAVLMINVREGDATRTTPVDAATRSALVDAWIETLKSPAMLERITAELRDKRDDRAAAVVRSLGPSGLGDMLSAHRRGQSYLVDVEAHAPTADASQALLMAAIEAYQDRQLDQRFAAFGSDHAAPAAATVEGVRVSGAADIARLETEKAQLLALAAQQGAPAPLPPADAAKAEALVQARGDVLAIKALLRSELAAGDIAAFRASGAVDRLGEQGAGLVKELLAYETAAGALASDPGKADDAKFHKYRVLTEATQLSPSLEKRVSSLALAAPATTPKAAPTPSADTIARLRQIDVDIATKRKLVETAAAARPVAAPTATAGNVDLDVRVVSHPTAGVSSVARQAVLLNAGAVAIAALLAATFSLVTIFISNTIINPGDAAALAGAPVVAALPRISGRQMQRLPPGERHPANFATEQPASAFADAMRKALASIVPPAGLSAPVCVAVAGGQPGDGASTVSLALARTAATRGIRVLLIDTDFESADLTKSMGINPAAGIEAIFAGDRQLMDLVVEDDMTSVHLLPSAPGAAGRAALSLNQLTSLKVAFASAKASYDLIIIDCQPHGTRSQARSLSRMADTALLVCGYDATRRDMFSALARRTRHNGADPCGVVLNLVPEPQRRVPFIFGGPSDATPMMSPPPQQAFGDVSAPRIIH